MKKRLLILAMVVLVLFLLFPRRYEVDDGGSVIYMSPLYCVTKYHMIDGENPDLGNPEAYLEGWRVEILGITVYYSVE